MSTLEELKGSAMSKEAKENGGGISKDSKASGIQSTVDKELNTEEFPAQTVKSTEMSKCGGQIEKGSRVTGVQAGADKIKDMS